MVKNNNEDNKFKSNPVPLVLNNGRPSTNGRAHFIQKVA